MAEDAFLMLSEELQQKAELHFVGSTPEWSKDYQDRIKEKQTKRIFLHEEIQDKEKLFRFYDSMDVFIVASRSESCSLVALEAAMLKKALLVTEDTGAKYVIGNSECVLPTGNVQRLMEKMSDYIENPQVSTSEGRLNCDRYLRTGTRKIFMKMLKRYLKKLKFERR